MWSGIIDKFSRSDVLTVHGISIPTGFFEVQLPTTIVDTTWPAEHGAGVGKALDLGRAIPDVYGNVPRVHAVYINEHLLTNTYDYALCRGVRPIPALYRSLMSTSDASKAAVSKINPIEYTISTTLYPGFTVARFPVQQITGGSPHEIYADIAASLDEEYAYLVVGPGGTARNAARIIRILLAERGQPIDVPAFNQAEVDCAVLGLYVDFAIQEPTALQDLLHGLLALRDMTLTQTSRGWALRVDMRPTEITYAPNDGDVEIPTSSEACRLSPSSTTCRMRSPKSRSRPSGSPGDERR